MPDFWCESQSRGSHAHHYVDNKDASIQRIYSGCHAPVFLPPGAHSLCIKMVNKTHVPIGAEQCISVKME